MIDLLPEQKEVADLGGTMRLGADPIKLHDSTRARRLYGEAVIYERHRHRYEVNNLLRKRLQSAGLVISGTSPDERLVEAIELEDHPFFVASQYHPEFKSRPERPAPLFRGFVAAALAHAAARGRRAATPARAAETGALDEALEGRRLAALSPTCARSTAPRARARRGRRVRAELGSLGLDVEEDDAGTAIGGDCGNLLARIPGPTSRRRTVLLCAHLDTVPALAPLEPTLTDGYWENAGQGILGADNKAAVAVLLILARRLVEQAARARSSCCSPSPRRSALQGSAAFDRSRLRSEFGFVFDHATADRRRRDGIADALPDRGDSSPAAAAHAGLEPERGRSAVLAAARAVAALRRAAWTRLRRRISRRSRAAARSTWCPTAAGSKVSCARWTARARSSSRPTSSRPATGRRTCPTATSMSM